MPKKRAISHFRKLSIIHSVMNQKSVAGAQPRHLRSYSLLRCILHLICHKCDPKPIEEHAAWAISIAWFYFFWSPLWILTVYMQSWFLCQILRAHFFIFFFSTLAFLHEVNKFNLIGVIRFPFYFHLLLLQSPSLKFFISLI